MLTDKGVSYEMRCLSTRIQENKLVRKCRRYPNRTLVLLLMQQYDWRSVVEDGHLNMQN